MEGVNRLEVFQSGGRDQSIQYPLLPGRESHLLGNAPSPQGPSYPDMSITQQLAATRLDTSPKTATQTTADPPKTAAELLQEKRDKEAERQEMKRRYDEKLRSWSLTERNMPSFQSEGPSATVANPSNDLISANFFGFGFSEKKSLKIYSIDLRDSDLLEPTNREVRRTSIDSFLKSVSTALKSQMWVTDYFANLVSVGYLFDGDSISGTESMSPPWPGPKIDVNVTISFKRDIDLDNLSNLVTRGRGSSEESLQEDIKALNLITWKLITKDTSQGRYIGKKFFPQKKKLCGRITRANESTDLRVFVARTGFFTSVRPGNGSLLLNVNVSTSAFYPEDNLQAWIEARCPNRNEQDWRQTMSEFVGLKVLSVLEKDELRPRKIVACGEEAEFQVVAKPDVTLLQRMKTAFPRVNFNKDALSVYFGAHSNPAWLPADQLIIEPWQPFRKHLHQDFNDSMLKIAERKLAEVKELVERYAVGPLGIKPNDVKAVQGDSKDQKSSEPELQERDSINVFENFLLHFGIKVNSNFIQMRSRELDPHIISFRENELDLKNLEPREKYNKRLGRNEPRERSSWDLSNMKFYEPKQYPKLTIINVYKRNDLAPTPKTAFEVQPESYKSEFQKLETWALEFAEELNRYGLETGDNPSIEFARFQRGANYKTRRENWQRTLDEARVKLSSGLPLEKTLLVIILPFKEQRAYSDIKWWADIWAGVPTLCLIRSKIERRKWKMGKRHFGNLCLKVNLKLGGTNYTLLKDPPFPKGSDREKTMVVEADVTHTQRGSDSTCPSLAAVVATFMPDSWQYSGSAKLQSRDTEHIAELRVMIEDRSMAYKRRHGYLPDQILFYRDGVSESQYGMVLSQELNQIKQAARNVAGDKSPIPKVTLLVVGKRHHTRFFPSSKCLTENIPAGLVIDHTVVNPQYFNFYLQSHDSPLGTTRSAHYVVIANESGYSPSELQAVTNKLCFTGSKQTRSLSACTPARYADLLCERLRCYMRPFLNGEVRAGRDKTIKDYQLDEYSWNFVEDEGGYVESSHQGYNPWHPRLEDSLFYL